MAEGHLNECFSALLFFFFFSFNIQIQILIGTNEEQVLELFALYPIRYFALNFVLYVFIIYLFRHVKHV